MGRKVCCQLSLWAGKLVYSRTADRLERRQGCTWAQKDLAQTPLQPPAASAMASRELIRKGQGKMPESSYLSEPTEPFPQALTGMSPFFRYRQGVFRVE